MRLLVVEDQKNIANSVSALFKQNMYEVDVAYDGEQGQYMIETDIYDAVILDIMLPKINGIKVLENVRKAGVTTPILLLTAKSQLEDKVLGLEQGADDYLTKPFACEELLARIRVLTRRRAGVIVEELKFEDITMPMNASYVEGGKNRVELSQKERQLMELFLCNPNIVIKKEVALEKLCGLEKDTTLNNVEVYVHFLRKKIDHISDAVNIRTVRGLGYVLEKKND
ncbi:MAG: response regulator transcription factor [Bacillota bacterium]